MMECPNGHGPMLQGQKYWLCEECDYREPLIAGTQPAGAKSLPGIERLPSVLAIPLHDYYVEAHPVMRLHRLFDTAEILTRFLAIIALGELRRKLDDKPIPETLLSRLQPNIERPDFGQ